MEIVTRVASSVVAKILENPVRLIGGHLGYLIYYQTNKKNLTDRVPKLNDKISSIQRRARAAQRNGEQLEECVTGWISEAERKIQEANDVINDRGHENAKCSCNGSFPNLMSRYKLSKKAKIMADNILIDLQNADDFRNFSYRPDVQPSFKNKDYEAFDTRMQASKEIMEALRDPNLTMIGVYGMGGIGKTTIVTEVARQAKEEECFSELVMVTVSQDFDLKSIQNRIAEGLGLTLDGENMSVRAKRLQNRLRQANKILIILDDIWNELDLSKAGIDFYADDQKGCKILLVSRVRDVLCNKMGVRKIIEVRVLSDLESMSLFYKYVGDKTDDPDFENLANQVVGECGGLPIAIVTIACSLKNKDLFVWKDFLSRLKRSCGMDGKVYSSTKMSYDFLESEEEKKVLLLCSLHGEDANVRVNDLMFYGIGLDLFQEVHAMEEARCRAHSLVDKLKAHCLLLDGVYKGAVKMHDVIRDVMISIAKEDEHMHCLTKVAELDKEDFKENSKAIILLGLDFDNQPLPRLVCPKLQLLLAFNRWNRYLSLGTIPDDFFKEAQELKALSFDCYPLQSLPQSFCTLQHLRALRLRLGKKEDLTLIGELRNLIVLDLSRSTFSQLPEHIGKLTQLESLNLSNCDTLRVIQPNVISSLVRLEEFYMDQVNIDWEVEGRVGEGRNASLMEFKNLRNLTTLHLNVRDANVLPQDMFSENLQRYRIKIGSFPRYTRPFRGSRLLYLNLRESSQVYQYGIQNLMKNSEGMWLEGFHGDNIVYELDVYSFPQLRELYVSSCPNLKYIFTVAMAGRLAQLETLKIRGCHDMEEVVVTNEHREGRLEKNSFPKLKYLELQELPNLRRFCTGDCIECPSLLKLEIKNCGVLRKFISSNEEEVEGPFFNEKVLFPSLRSSDVSSCPNLKYLFTVAVAGELPQLETLKIRECHVMEEVVVTNEHGQGRLEKILFPKLKYLELQDLPNLKRFCAGDCIECPSLLELRIGNCGVLRKFISSNEEEFEGPFFNEKVSFPILEYLRLTGMNSKILWADQLSITSFGMQNLKRLHVASCDSLSHLFSLDVARSLLQLENLQLTYCKDMEEVLVTKEPIEEGTPQKIYFPKLEDLELSNLQNIRRFCAGCCIEFPSLTKMEMEENPAMRTFITDSCNGASGELMGSEARQPLFNGKVAFPKLEALSVDDLNSVNSLFSFAVAKSLVTLETLQVWSCSLMEEIVQVNEQGEEGRLDKISFPKLQRILFSGLSNLKRFYGGACIEFPSLLKLEIIAYEETKEIMDIVVAEQHLVFNEVLGPNLEQLTTRAPPFCWSELIKEMCNCPSSRAPPFCNLKVVDLKWSRNEPIGFSLKCIQRYQNLESLSLSGFFVDTTHHHQQLTVSSEEHLYEDSKDLENSSLESLKFLHIRECDKLMSPLLSATTSFQNLMALVVSKCSAMINLLASSTARALVHLRLMSITKCKQMTEIIADEIMDDNIVFGKLEILELSDLPSLRSFHSAGNSVMRFPNLVMLVVSQCPEMRRFSSGMIDAPKLDSISEIQKNEFRWRWLRESNFDFKMSRLPKPQQKLWEGDINKTLERLWEEDYSLVMQWLFTET